MASELIRDLLTQKGICNIDNVEFIKCSGYNGGSVNEIAVVTVTDDKDDLRLFLKICKKETFLADVNSQLLIYDKENAFYNEILPFLMKSQQERLSKSESDVPIDGLCFKTFGSGVVDGDIYVVLEKFRDEQYYVTQKDEFHSNDQIHCAMRSIASFHAVSFCVKVMENVNFVGKYPILEDKLYNPRSRQCIAPLYVGKYDLNLKVIKAFISEMENGNVIMEKHRNLCKKLDVSVIARLEKLSGKVMDILHWICESKSESAVCCHGDFHMGNIAFDKTNKNKAILFDYQLIRFAPGFTDVNQYLFQVSKPVERKRNLKSYLQAYCDAFKVVCDEMGLDNNLNIFTLDFITKEYNQTSPWGFLFGFMFLMYRFVPSDVYTKLSSLESSVEIVDLLKGYDSFWMIFEVYIDLILEGESNGVISLMETLVADH